MNLSEATTRNFDDPVTSEPRRHHVNVGATTPSYLAPDPYPPMQALPTHRIDHSRYKWTIIALASLVLILLLALGVIFFARYSPEPRVAGGLPGTPEIVIPRPPEAPAPPAAPDTPPPPPGIPGDGRRISADLIYPGAEEIGRIKAGPVASVVRLRASATVEEVVQWYEYRLTGEKVIKTPNGNTVISLGSLAIMIKPGPGGTNIMITGALTR
ncbi:MAG TPA: hypothetical protein VNO14_18855 [Blastocatellia bacterium]|nr:hypothetical protein [Blastocatellia bacterium]